MSHQKCGQLGVLKKRGVRLFKVPTLHTYSYMLQKLLQTKITKDFVGPNPLDGRFLSDQKNYMFIGLGKVQNMSFLRSKMIHIMSPFICNNHLLFTFQIKMAVNDTQFDTRISSDAMTKLFIFFSQKCCLMHLCRWPTTDSCRAQFCRSMIFQEDFFSFLAKNFKFDQV